MAYRFNKADGKLFGDIRAAATRLEERVQDMQSDWDDSTERWQDSDRGIAVQDWLTTMEDSLRAISDAVDELEDSEPSEV